VIGFQTMQRPESSASRITVLLISSRSSAERDFVCPRAITARAVTSESVSRIRPRSAARQAHNHRRPRIDPSNERSQELEASFLWRLIHTIGLEVYMTLVIRGVRGIAIGPASLRRRRFGRNHPPRLLATLWRRSCRLWPRIARDGRAILRRRQHRSRRCRRWRNPIACGGQYGFGLPGDLPRRGRRRRHVGGCRWQRSRVRSRGPILD